MGKYLNKYFKDYMNGKLIHEKIFKCKSKPLGTSTRVLERLKITKIENKHRQGWQTSRSLHV